LCRDAYFYLPLNKYFASPDRENLTASLPVSYMVIKGVIMGVMMQCFYWDCHKEENLIEKWKGSVGAISRV
jgi:hypothetical protein